MTESAIGFLLLVGFLFVCLFVCLFLHFCVCVIAYFLNGKEELNLQHFRHCGLVLPSDSIFFSLSG